MADKRNYEKNVSGNISEMQRLVRVAAGMEDADIVLKHASFVNVFTNQIETADIACVNGRIAGIGSYTGKEEIYLNNKIVCPGFIDGHIHLESSLVVPKEFAKAVLPHGTTTVITDPHEIANVMGTDGIDYMMQVTEGLPVDVYFMLPSCVPATSLDEAGAVLTAEIIKEYYQNPRVLGLAEMMNYAGVEEGDAGIMAKITDAFLYNRIVDGHAPGLKGKALNAYVAAGIYSDHECSVIEEAIEKLSRGQFIMIREGTAARNLEALSPLLKQAYSSRCMFCTDDKHPNDLLHVGHMDAIIKKAVRDYGVDPIIAVKAASYQTAAYFGLKDKGAIAPGYRADFAIVNNLKDFYVEMTISKGRILYDACGVKPFPTSDAKPKLVEMAHHTFHVKELTALDFVHEKPAGVIGIIPGEIVTTNCSMASAIDVKNDILKIAVIERHHGTQHIGVGYLHGYGMREGAVATSIAHDSHNIIVVGTNEADMAFAVNCLVKNGGGMVAARKNKICAEVVLEIAGLMSESDLDDVNRQLEYAKKQAFDMGVKREIDPFMTLSFMSLTVIPKLRLSTKGVVDTVTQKVLE